MIQIYPNKLGGGPLEERPTFERMTLGAWLSANVKGFERRESPPISIELNGELVEPSGWESTEFGPFDLVNIYLEPKGAAWAVYAIAAAVAVAASYLFAPSMPGRNSGTPQGRQLDLASVKGNHAKLNSVIREVAGRQQIFPDLLVPPHRWFASEREQFIEMLLCVGMGEFAIESRTIGDTPIESMGSAVTCKVYPPGADLTNEPAAQHWHNCQEVGATSTGAAGLELRSVPGEQPVVSGVSLHFSGNTIRINDQSVFPNWSVGDLLRIELPLDYTVTDDDPNRDIIAGPLTALGAFPGMKIDIAGSNPGQYVVHSYNASAQTMTLDYANGEPAGGLEPGSARMSIGYRGLLYRISAIEHRQYAGGDGETGEEELTLQRLTDTGAIDSAWPGFSAINSTSASVVVTGNDLPGDWSGPFAACPEGELVSDIEWDVMFQSGLCGLDSKGRLYDQSVQTELQYRDVALGGTWLTFSRTYKRATMDQIGFTERASLPYPMRPEVRMRRIGAESTSTNVMDKCQWYGLRARMALKPRYEGVTTIALRVRGGQKLSSQTENQFAVVATRILPVRAGGSWAGSAPTRDIAPWVAHVAKSIGYTDDDLDWTELDRLGATWAARGDRFDASVDKASTVKACIADAFAAGFSDITIDRGKIRPVRDEQRSTFEHMYTPQNMTSPLVRRFTAPADDDFDGVDVEYLDGVTWQKTTVECRLPGDIGRRVEKIKVEGVTDRTRAWRLGMRRRREQKYRRWSYRWSTELDGLNSRYLSYCAVADDVPGYGKSALLLSFAASDGVVFLESSEPLPWGDGAHVVGIRRPDGTLSGPWPATRVDDYRLTIPALDFTPDTSWQIEPPHLLFGPVDRWSFPVLINKVSPSGGGASVEAFNYDARIYADDNNAPA
ncbi:host specificity factor TipJ family phage tail protein [Pseudomonas sp.]|uniref:host specificity factor TipJ family phage tail protein n=1 Tax=Pseudomonas sp. TaxID=306 RepID=UPI0019F32C92|nr:host specificity factor TipJ family phage tail protein [Pseudomonas sp.]MBF0675598.1 hypothetical protein [Pseudomonas sp.]